MLSRILRNFQLWLELMVPILAPTLVESEWESTQQKAEPKGGEGPPICWPYLNPRIQAHLTITGDSSILKPIYFLSLKPYGNKLMV